jgi:hypothetical protein
MPGAGSSTLTSWSWYAEQGGPDPDGPVPQVGQGSVGAVTEVDDHVVADHPAGPGQLTEQLDGEQVQQAQG